jgi:hypothetical protein
MGVVSGIFRIRPKLLNVKDNLPAKVDIIRRFPALCATCRGNAFKGGARKRNLETPQDGVPQATWRY